MLYAIFVGYFIYTDTFYFLRLLRKNFYLYFILIQLESLFFMCVCAWDLNQTVLYLINYIFMHVCVWKFLGYFTKIGIVVGFLLYFFFSVVEKMRQVVKKRKRLTLEMFRFFFIICDRTMKRQNKCIKSILNYGS